MALTRKMLKVMGIEDEKIDEIIDAHTESTDALKKQRDEYKEAAEKLPEVQKELDNLKAVEPDDYKDKYEAEKKAFEDYKAQVAADKLSAEKSTLYRSMLEEMGIDKSKLDAIMKVTDLDSIEIKDGKISDLDNVKESAKSEWSAFITEVKDKGASVDNPPAGDKGGKEIDLGTLSMEDYIKARKGK